MEHQVVAVLHLGDEQAVLTTMVLTLGLGKEWREEGQLLLTTAQQILGGGRVSQFLESLGVAAFQEGIGTLLEVNLLLAHPGRDPVMLIQTHSGGEGKVDRKSTRL